MKATQRSRHTLLRWISCALGILALFGCGDTHLQWNEQVKLNDGEVILITRSAKFSENWVAGGGGGSLNKGMTIQLQQQQKSDSPSLWEGRFVPIVLDRDPDSKEWFIVATFYHCDGWYELGRPKLPYTEYRFRGGTWIQQPLAPKWIGRPANVIPADPSIKSTLSETKPVLTIERKDSFFNNPAVLPEYKRIVDSWTSGC
jgi:hypothetical protein